MCASAEQIDPAGLAIRGRRLAVTQVASRTCPDG